jgi:demethylmenaquinone methyltransferase/2-methoxy-6-polyprenyl-1,4-benzoquinol methylase
VGLLHVVRALGRALERVKGKYDRNSRFYDSFEYLTERFMFSKWRRELVRGLSGTILELGVGTGKNLKYYPEHSRVVGVDISEGMLEEARKKSRGLSVHVSLVKADAQRLCFKDDSFHTMALTYVLCSARDPGRPWENRSGSSWRTRRFTCLSMS